MAHAGPFGHCRPTGARTAVFVITVVDGLVVAQRDFVDYFTFRASAAGRRRLRIGYHAMMESARPSEA